MIAAILIFFLAIFVGFALLGITTYLYSRRLKSMNIKHFNSSGDYTAIHSSSDSVNVLDDEFESNYVYTPGAYIEEEVKREESAGFEASSKNAPEIANYPSSSSTYSHGESSSSYDSSSSDSSSGSDSGSSSSSSD